MAALQIIKNVNGYFRFILDGNQATSTIDNAPNCTSFDTLFHFKTKNGAVLFGEQNISYSDITYTDTSAVNFTFASVDAVWIKLISEGFFDGLGSSGGGGGAGVDRFDNLLDAFKYPGNNGKVPVVDAAQLKLIPTTFYNFKDFIQLEDVAISSLIAGKIIGVELVGGVPKVVLRDPPPSPELLANAVGWMDYADAGTTTTPLTLVANVNKKLTNDTLGAFTNTANAPFGVPTIWNSTTNSFDFNFLTVGDTIDIRFDIKVTTTSANQVVKAFLRLAEGTPSQYDIPFTEVQFKTADTHDIIRNLKIYIGSEEVRTAPASFYVNTDSSGTCIVNGWFNEITRKGVNIVTLQADATNLISSDPNNALQLGTDNLLFVPETASESKITLTDAATTVWDFSTGSYAEWTIGGNRTLSVTNLPSGKVATGTLKLIQDGTGGRTVSFTGNSADVAIKVAAAAQTLIKFYWDGTNLTWFSENQAGGGSARRYYMRINVDGNQTAYALDTWYSFDRTYQNYNNGTFYDSYGTASAPVLATLFSKSIGITPPPNTKLISAVQRFETTNSWSAVAILETQIYSNESADATAANAVSGNQLLTNDSWPTTANIPNVRQRRNLSIQPHSAFTGNTELFIAVRKRVLNGSGMRALEFLLIFEEQ